MAVYPNPVPEALRPEPDGGPEALDLDVAGDQIMGDRDVQEDAFFISHLGGAGTLLIVADGMGGHAAGNIASNMAAQACNRRLSHCDPSQGLTTALREAVLEANKTIADMVHETEALRGMGCTLVAAVAHGATLSWASVGDSHLYLLRGGGITKLNADHSYGGFLERMAELGQPVEPEPGCSRNMLMCALTGDDILEIDCPDAGAKLAPGDWLVLSTDGLNTINRDDIIAIAAGASSARECAERLLQAVTEAGAKKQDNTTVVAIRVSERPQSARPLASASVPEPPTETVTPYLEPGPVPEAERQRATRPRYGRGRLGGSVLVAIIGALAYYWLAGRGPETSGPAAPDAEATVAETRSEAVPGDAGLAPAIAETQQEAHAPAAPDAAAPPSFRDPLKSGSQGPEMVWIPAGRYDMGSSRPGADPDERPQHAVHIGRFAIGRFEVSDAEYGRFARGAGRRLPPIRPPDPNSYPVVSVSWHDAVAFARWLSQETGRRYRLASEAEWEYAAAAGTGTPYWWGYRVGAEDAYCHGCGNGVPSGPGPIGRFRANSFGLFDSAGNVLEWVQDCYAPSYEGASTDGAAREADRCEERVARGGGFSTPTRALRTTKRSRFDAAQGYDDVGIRVARDP